jgi:hypothetical protein
MNYPENKNLEDHSYKTFNDYTLNTIEHNDLFNFGKNDAISSCSGVFIEEKENLNEISDLLKNLSKEVNFDSDEDTTSSQEEIRCILRKNSSNLSLNNFQSDRSSRKISMVGRILHSDNNIFSKIVTPVKNNKSIPIRVSNPVYKNFDRDN